MKISTVFGKISSYKLKTAALFDLYHFTPLTVVRRKKNLYQFIVNHFSILIEFFTSFVSSLLSANTVCVKWSSFLAFSFLLFLLSHTCYLSKCSPTKKKVRKLCRFYFMAFIFWRTLHIVTKFYMKLIVYSPYN